MEPITIREILDAVRGKILGDFVTLDMEIPKVETDSRTIHPGSLFVPLIGDQFDGHAYINAALEGGAAACLTQRERESYLPGKCYIKVESTARALRELAVYYKKKFRSPWWPSPAAWERPRPRTWWPPFWGSTTTCSKPRGT